MFVMKYILFLLINFKMYQNLSFSKNTNCSTEYRLKVEFYTKDDSLFMAFSERVAWFEAASICKTYDAELSVLNTTKKAHSVANFLAESNAQSSNYWLGARKINDYWMWINGQNLKDSNLAIPWLKNDDSPGVDCLTIEIASLNVSMLVDIACYVPQSFICERSLSFRPKKPLPSLPTQQVTVNTSMFTFYHGRVTWEEALVFCRSLGQRLAVIPDENYINFVAAGMLRTRPNMENAWIGGYYRKGAWMWLPMGVEIPNETNIETNYPPWNRNNTRDYVEACLLFDRHLVSNYFHPARCQRRRDFICESYVYRPIEYKNDTITCEFASGTVFIYLIDKNWTEAQKHCHDTYSVLAEPLDRSILKAIAVCLGDHPAEPKHVWLGAKRINNKWMWINSHKCVDSSFPWCEDEFDENAKCLNMDRTDHDEPWIYGLKCKQRQPFVCQVGEISTTTEDPPTTPSCECPCMQQPINMNYYNKTFVAYFFKIEPNEQFHYYCKRFGGKPFSAAYSEEVQNYVLTYIRLSIYHCECCTDDAVNFWINDKSGTGFSLINLDSGKITDMTSNYKETNPFICEAYCTINTHIGINENSTINCDWITAAGAIPYKSCKFYCGAEHSLFGPDHFTCDKYGWKMFNVERSPTSFLFPECIDVDETPKKLLTLLNEIEPKGLYFVIKEPTGIDHSKWQTLLQFVMSIIQVFPISKENPLGLLTFGDEVAVRIPYNATDNCQTLTKISKLQRAVNGTSANYNLAFEKVQDEIARHRPNQKTLIFCIVDQENTGMDYDSFVINLHIHHVIFSIAIRKIFIFDADMTASYAFNHRLYSMKVRSYSLLTDIALDLLDFRSPNINCSESLYILPDLNTANKNSKQLPKATLQIIQKKNITYYLIQNYASNAEANTQCKEKYGGKLINETDAKHFVKNTNMRKYYINYFWVQKTVASKCVAMDVFTKLTEKFDCSKKFPFLCVIDCSVLPPNTDRMLSSSLNERHDFDCYDGDEILKGAPNLQCDSNDGGWSTEGLRTSPFPSCLSGSDWVREMITLLNAKRKIYKAGIIFAIDESTTQIKNDFEGDLKFVETIVKLYPASKSQPYGLISFSEQPYVRLSYEEENSCKILQKLASMKKKSYSHTVSYQKAIAMADKQISKFRQTGLTVIFIFTTGVFNEELLRIKEAIYRIGRYNVEIYVLKIGDFDSEVVSELPTRDSEYNLQLFSFHNFIVFNKLTDRLLNESNLTAVKC